MSLKISPKELDFSFSRSSGAGGQNVNKVNSKVTLRWDVRASHCLNVAQKKRFLEKFKNKIDSEGMFSITSQSYRDQSRNIADCVEKLHELLVKIEYPPKKRVPTKPSKAAIQKRLDQKKKHSERKKQRQKY